MSSVKQYCPLHVHSQYSFLEGAIHLKQLPKKLHELHFTACAITDHGNIHGAIQFYNELRRSNIKPIIGQGFKMQPVLVQGTDKLFNINLICHNIQGYYNLIKLTSLSFRKSTKTPFIDLNDLQQYGAGLTLILPGAESELFAILQNTPTDRIKADNYLALLNSQFKNQVYIEIYPLHADNIGQSNNQLLDYIKTSQHPAIISGNSFYLNKDEAYSQFVLRLIGQKEKISAKPSEAELNAIYYLQSEEDLRLIFKSLEPELLNRLIYTTGEIAEACELLDLKSSKYFLPEFKPPNNVSLNDHFRAESFAGLEKRSSFLARSYKWDEEAKTAHLKKYQERLEYEIQVIISMGFCGYFMIVADIVGYAKNNGVLVGPGRGSGAGSLVAYSLQITDVDPVKYDLLFERFLNPDRISLPDFDIDFEANGRDKVIAYVKERYGEKNVAQISAIGTLQARNVIRSVGRALNISYGQVDQISKLIPNRLGINLTSALEESRDLKAIHEGDDARMVELIDLSLILEGLSANLSTHAAGLVIMDVEISDRLPTCLGVDGVSVQTQYSMEDVESQGAVKFDFLGLKNLTIIDDCLKLIKESGLEPPNINELPLDDPKPYKLISDGFCSGIFQLESEGIKPFIREFAPDCFDDIIALIGIYRPGPLQSGMANDFILRKKGIQEFSIKPTLLEPILRATYGVIIYQEQVMRIAQVMAGFTLAQADLLRKAMGKKLPAELLRLKTQFIDGCKVNQINPTQAKEIYDLIEKFGGYGFNKSHSTAYGLICFQTAYLKQHYRAQFMSALMSNNEHNQKKVGALVRESRILGQIVLPPDVNTSFLNFQPIKDKKIAYGLRTIKNLSINAAKGLVDERLKNGQYKDLSDFFHRQNLSLFNAKSYESLVKSGAFDSIFPDRSLLEANLDVIIKQLSQLKSSTTNSSMGLFTDEELGGKPEIRLSEVAVKQDYLYNFLNEQELLGWAYSKGPNNFYSSELKLLEKLTNDFEEVRLELAQLTMPSKNSGQKFNLIGNVASFAFRSNTRGSYYGIVTLQNETADFELWLNEPAFSRYKLYIEQNVPILAECMPGRKQGELQISRLVRLDILRQTYCEGIEIELDPETLDTSLPKLKEILQQNRGRLPVHLSIDSANKNSFLLEERVSITDKLCKNLSFEFDLDRIHYKYSHVSSDMLEIIN